MTTPDLGSEELKVLSGSSVQSSLVGTALRLGLPLGYAADEPDSRSAVQLANTPLELARVS